MTTITINGTMTLDESLGLQTGGIAIPGEDNNDSDVSLGTLQTGAVSFYNRLFNSIATGGLGLNTTFATNNGVAESASNFITVSGGTVASLGFVDGSGGALPTYAGVATGGVATQLSALNGGAISLFADATLGNRMVLGVDANNDIVFAIFMDPNAALTSSRVWMVQFEAISNPNASNPDDSVNLFDSIGVAATTTLNFDFNSLHSGSNLFGAVGDTTNSLIVIAEHPVINQTTGEFSTAPNGVIKTSQGGGPTTIGVNSQMFDPGEGAYFTYVKGSVSDVLGANLSQTEANNANNIQYTNGTNAALGASLTITQTQGNSTASMKITCYDIAGSPQSLAFVNGLGSGAIETITSVKVNGVAVSFTVDGNGVIVSGLHAGDTISWTTSAPHDRVLIEGVAGKFDIGGFAITSASSASVDIGQQLTFEDSGPSAAIALAGGSVAHDESSGVQGADTAVAPVATLVPGAGGVSNASTDYLTDDPSGSIYATSAAAVVSTSGSSAGTDAFGATTVLSLSVAAGGVDSGLTTTDGTKIFLFKEGDVVVGRIGADAAAALGGQAAFAVAIDANGFVSTAQYASLKHGSAETNGDASEAVSIANTALQAVVTVTDGDGDKATQSVDIGSKVQFLDDGPSAAIALAGGSVAHDESSGVQGADTAVAPVATLVPGAGGVSNASTDYLTDDPSGSIYAMSAAAVVQSNGSTFGADEEGASKAYSLSVAAGGVDSGLTTTDGTKIFLFKEGDVVVGRIGADAAAALGGQAAFAVAIDANGFVSTAQYASLKHGSAETNGDASEAVSIANTALQAVVTVTDGDGDKATQSVDIGSKVQFLDDGPSAAIALAGGSVAHDESSGVQGADTAVAPVATLVPGAGGVSNASTDYLTDDPSGSIYAMSAAAVVQSNGSAFGADEEGASKAYSLSVAAGGVDSGLTTTDGTKIFLFKEGDVVVGRIGADAAAALGGQAAFAVAIDANGFVSVAQYASLHHGIASNGDTSEAVSIANTALQAVVTVTDGDGDKATQSVDIGSKVQFLDDGPSAAIALAGGSVAHDESSGVQGADTAVAPVATLVPGAGGVSNASTDYLTDDPSGSIYAMSAAAVVQSNGSTFGADEEGASKAYSLSVAAGGVDSGLTTTDGTKIFLFKEGDVVVGRIGADAAAALGGQAAFAVAIDANGFVSTAQYASLKHGSAETNGDASEAVSIANTALQAVVTVTDGDGDKATQSVDIGSKVQFLDDGPSAAIALAGGSVAHDESSGVQGADTAVAPVATLVPGAGGVSNASTDYLTDDPSGSIYAMSAAAVVQSNGSTFGADEEGASKAYSLSVAAGGVDSGLTTTDGTKIFLFKEGDVVVGRIGADAAAALGGQAAFAVAIDANGFVSTAQYASLHHGIASNGDTSEAVSIANTALQAVVTVTDGDGDKATQSVDIGSKVQFLDDGPSITVNNITNGTYAAGGSSTWPEAPGADGFKSLAITLNDYTIDSHSTVTVNSLLGTDTTTDASGNYVFNGTINADFNGDGISDAVAFTLAFKPGADTYTISVTTPPPSIVTFDTSQGSLAPGGPNPVQSLTFSSGPAAGQSVVFFGAVATAPAKLDNVADNPPNDILDLVGLGQPDLTKAQINALLGPPNQISTLINASTQMNVSTSGIGVNNNNLDGSGAGIQSTDESFVVNPSQLVDQVKVFIDNSVGGYNPGTEDLEYRVYYSDGTVSANTKVQAGDLSPVTSGVANGGKSFVISDVAGGPQIDAVQLTMANGTIKIPVIQFSIQQSFLPQPVNMNLTATLTDGDNDTSKSTFSIALA